MSYLSVLPLQSAKDYLAVDDTARDNEITRMINSAFKYIENYTNVILFSREKTFYKGDGNLKVYDFPINTEVKTSVRKGTYTEFEGDEVTLNVGYKTPRDVPSDIVDAALMIIEKWFYGSEKKTMEGMIPIDAKMILDLHKRFLI